MRHKLSDPFVRSAKAEVGQRLDISDEAQRGLRLRVSPDPSRPDGMRRVWAAEVRVKAGPKRKITLGEYPEMSLAAARNLAAEIRVEARNGIDRIGEAEKARAAKAADEARKVTVRAVLANYIDMNLSQLRSGAERTKQLQAVLSSILDTHITDMNTAFLQAAIDAKAREGKIVMANRLRSAIRAFTKWAWRRGYVAEDIGAKLDKAGDEKARELTLSISEVATIYQACEKLQEPWRSAFRLLVLTGQRRGEILGLQWRDIKENEIELSGSKTKNGKPHITHLTTAAKACFGERGSPDAFIFGSTGGTSNVSHAKKQLDKILGNDFPSWRLHDLRRAMATALAAGGIDERTVDKLLNHGAVGSAPSAVAGVYNRHDRLPERRVALEKWTSMVTGNSAKVLKIHG
ncbi:tyrosine-type recombinase/integrase [Pseudooceanicola sp. MF1-13]|uniref:tyrosine-type recombinase/integrase n=1 Tax=Pseudooceanicola sp. MF1-13 TaxID=3379095 RepID=UPI003891ECBD